MEVVLLQDLEFLCPQRLLVSNGVGFSYLHRVAEKGPCKRLICTEGLQTSPSTETDHLLATANPFKPLNVGFLWLPSKAHFADDNPLVTAGMRKGNDACNPKVEN